MGIRGDSVFLDKRPQSIRPIATQHYNRLAHGYGQQRRGGGLAEMVSRAREGKDCIYSGMLSRGGPDATSSLTSVLRGEYSRVKSAPIKVMLRPGQETTCGSPGCESHAEVVFFAIAS